MSSCDEAEALIVSQYVIPDCRQPVRLRSFLPSFPVRVCELRCSSGLTVQTTLTGKRNAADERFSPNESRTLAHSSESVLSLSLRPTATAKLLPRFRDLGQCHLIRTLLRSLVTAKVAIIRPLNLSVHRPHFLHRLRLSGRHLTPNLTSK